MLRWFYAVVVGGILSGFTFLLITGHYLKDGPVLITVAQGHGLHAGDLFVFAGWAVGMVALALLAGRPDRVGGRALGSAPPVQHQAGSEQR